MRIGIITDAIDDGSAGISVYTENLVKNILKIDQDNEYVLIHHKKSSNNIYNLTKELIVPLKKIPFAREYRKVIQLPKILEKKGFDIVHETTQIGPFFKKYKFKKVVSIHDLVTLKFPKTQSFLSFIHHKIGLKITLKNVDYVIADSYSTKKDIVELLNYNSKKIKVAYLGLKEIKKNEMNKEKVLSKYKIKEPYLFYLGTLEPRKNIPNLIKSFKIANVDSTLVIGGEKGWKYKEIFRLVKRLKLGNLVQFPGFIDNKDLHTIYKNAQAFVFPSLYEGFGLPVLEAMSCGCPVITSNVSSLPEVSGNASILINPKSSKDIAKAIIAIQDLKLRKRLIKKGLKQAKKFKWGETAMNTIKIYEDLKRGIDK